MMDLPASYIRLSLLERQLDMIGMCTVHKWYVIPS